jgi:hypothetical protein
MFPPYVRNLIAAVDYLPLWAETIGGVVLDGLDVTEVFEDAELVAVEVARFRIGFDAHGTVLSVGLAIAADLATPWYSFDLRRQDGRLLWRHDNHPGHEAEHAGKLTHVHIGPDEDHRVLVATPVTLEDIAAKVVSTHINLS